MRLHLLRIALPLGFLLAAGCTHTTYIADSKNPEVEFSEDGGLMWRGRFIELYELADLLEDAGVSKQSQIDIRISDRMRSLKAPRALLFLLRKRGYTRGVLVTKKHAYSESSPVRSGKTPPPAGQPVRRGKIRYK